MSNYCDILKLDPAYRVHQKKGLEIMDFFNNQPNINKIYGKIEGHGKANEFAQDVLVELAEKVTDGKPFDKGFILSEGDYNRIKREIVRLNKDLGGKIGVFEAATLVPKAIVDRYPNMRMFLNNLNEISNYERNSYAEYTGFREQIAKHLKAAFVTAGVQKRFDTQGILSKLDKTERLVYEALANNDFDKLSTYWTKMSEQVGKEGGNVLKDYFHFMEKGEVVYIDPITKEQRIVSDHIVLAGKASKDLLNSMGKVLIGGLRKASKLSVDILAGSGYNNKSLPTGKIRARAENFNSSVKSKIAAIETQMRDGNYFPHYLLSGMMNIRKNLETMLLTNDVESHDRGLVTMSAELDKLLSSVNVDGTIDRAKGRADEDHMHELWDKNPLGALKRYSSDVISFNKLIHMQAEYLKGLSDLEGVDGQMVESMRKYMEHTFDTAVKGYSGRDPWVNKVTRTIGAYEFASKLGFGMSTAIRNLLSGTYYFSSLGTKMYGYIDQYKTLGKKDRSSVQEVIGEMGFTFIDKSKMANELIAEGILPAEGVRKDSLYYDLKDNKWRYEQDGVWKRVSTGLDWAVGKSAVFQRWTENYLRETMFTASFMRALEVYRSDKAYISKFEKISKGKDGKAILETNQDLYRKAGKVALQTVNKFAFDYSIFNKAPVIGGTHKNLGAVGQMLGVFMHYPMSFANLQAQTFKGAKDALMSGQGLESGDLRMALAFSGIYLVTGLLSGVTNMDLDFWLNNDTADRIQNIVEYLKADDEEERRKITYGGGAVSLISGPVAGDIRKIVNGLMQTVVANDIISRPDSDLLNFLTDFEHYSKMHGDEKAAYHLRMINNQAFKVASNWIPAFQTGRPGHLITKEFKFHPTKRSKAKRDFINNSTKAIFGKELLPKPIYKTKKTLTTRNYDSYRKDIGGALARRDRKGEAALKDFEEMLKSLKY